MGEYFDLAFYLDKEKAKRDSAKVQMLKLFDIEEGENVVKQHQYPLFTNREVQFYDYEEVDYIQYYICLSEMVFTKKNFEIKLDQLLQVVTVCLNRIDSILLATGVFEMTPIYLDKVKTIKDFSKKVFERFPFSFFREGNEYGMRNLKCHGNVLYAINQSRGVQDIFSNPISELMEDYGISFEAAQRELELQKRNSEGDVVFD